MSIIRRVELFQISPLCIGHQQRTLRSSLMLNQITKTTLTAFAAIALVGGLSVQAQAATTSFNGNSSAKASQSFNSGRSVNTRRAVNNRSSVNRRGFNNNRSINRRGLSSNRSRSGFNRSNIGFSNGYFTRSRSSHKSFGRSSSRLSGFRSRGFGYGGYYGGRY